MFVLLPRAFSIADPSFHRINQTTGVHLTFYMWLTGDTITNAMPNQTRFKKTLGIEQTAYTMHE